MALPAQLQDPVLYAIPAFLVFIGLELLSMRVLKDPDSVVGFEAKDSRTSIYMGLVSVFITGGSRFAALFGYAALYAVTPLRMNDHRWYTWVAVIVLVDLIFYCYHRASHRIRLLWAGHQAHHNSQHFNYTTALRQKWNPWFELLAWTPLPLLGVPPWMIFTCFSINLLFQFWVHTERIGKLWGPFEFLFNTPSHHRIHHASDKDYLDKNYAGILMIWDRMFGSYVDETHRPTYGLTKNVNSHNLLVLQYHEYGAIWRDVRATGNWHDKLGYVFGPPAWTPATPAAGQPEMVTQPAGR